MCQTISLLVTLCAHFELDNRLIGITSLAGYSLSEPN